MALYELSIDAGHVREAEKVASLEGRGYPTLVMRWDTRIFDQRKLEEMQFAYIRSGFHPEWDRDPYRVFAYTTMQERERIEDNPFISDRSAYDEVLHQIVGSEQPLFVHLVTMQNHGQLVA